jgi:hypothetical protein
VTVRSPFDVHEEEPPHALTTAEVEEVVEAFVGGAARAARGGVDSIEINAADDHLPRQCRINACFGTEQYDLAPLRTKKRVLVVGGGPVSMQATRIAALRGHEVRLWDKGRSLGGATPLANMVKEFEVDELNKFNELLRQQVEKVGFKVELGREFDPSVAGTSWGSGWCQRGRRGSSSGSTRKASPCCRACRSSRSPARASPSSPGTASRGSSWRMPSSPRCPSTPTGRWRRA